MQLVYVIFFIIFIINLSENRAQSLSVEAIVGGSVARRDQFKYQVSVLENDYPICGGGVIGSKFILSALHCIINAMTNKLANQHLTVLAPAVNQSDHNVIKIIYEIDKVYRHKSYQPSDSTPNTSNRQGDIIGDLIILQLKEDLYLETNDKLERLLIHKDNFSYIGETAVIVGKGYNMIKLTKNLQNNITIEHGSSDGKLRFITVELVAHSICHSEISDPFHHFLICAKAVQQNTSFPEGTCVGDSGGPLVYKGNVVIGVLIRGPIGCNEQKYGAIYTKVSPYYNFIDNVLRNQLASDIQVFAYRNIDHRFRKYEFVEN